MTASKLNKGHVLCLVLVLGLVSAGCDHVTDAIDGPRLVDRFGDFALLEPLEVSRQTVDFAGGESVFFTARFNKQVNWVVEITGEQSGAVKRIEGFSDELTADNAVWNGGTTDLPLFKNEPVDVALFVPDEIADTTFADVTVLAPRAYPGIVAAAFEGGEDITVFDPEFEFESGPVGDGESECVHGMGMSGRVQ